MMHASFSGSWALGKRDWAGFGPNLRLSHSRPQHATIHRERKTLRTPGKRKRQPFGLLQLVFDPAISPREQEKSISAHLVFIKWESRGEGRRKHGDLQIMVLGHKLHGLGSTFGARWAGTESFTESLCGVGSWSRVGKRKGGKEQGNMKMA
jgi:hypothetical protein